MKRRLIIASAVLALLSTALCGCTDREPAALFDPAEPTSSMTSSDEKSAPESTTESTTESLPESMPESSVESTTNGSESEPENSPQSAASYTVKITTFEDGKPIGATVETYDGHGNVIKSVSKNSSYFYTYEYNDDGTIRVKYDDDGREEYTYENGLLISCTRYEYGRVAYVMTHTYDEHENEVERTFEILGTVDRYTYEFTYDENGVWTKELIYNTKGERTGIYTRVLGENGEDLGGRLEEENSVFSYEYKYDEEGREVELHTAYALGGAVVGENRTVTEYDEQGRISRREKYRLDGGEQLTSTEEYNYKR